MNEKLLLVEDSQSGDCCCDLQNSHRAQIKKMSDVIDGRRQRFGGVVAIGSNWRATDDNDEEPVHRFVPAAQNVETDIKERPITSLESLQAILMADRAGFRGNRRDPRPTPPWSFIAVASPQWDGSCVRIGEEGTHFSCDFFQMPRHRTQRARGEANHAGRINAHWSGQVKLRRVGPWLDVCVGTYANKKPLIHYRFHVEDFLPASGPAAKVKGVTPETIEDLKPDELHSVRNVNIGNELVQAFDPIHYLIADTDGRDTNSMYVRDCFPADQRRQLRAALKMSDALSSGENLSAKLQEVRTLLEFPRECLGNFVTGEFQVTTALKRDLLLALGPNGVTRGGEHIMLKIEADTTAKIAAISNLSASIVISYDNGREQIVPPCSQLMKLTSDGLQPLAVGMEITAGERIGDYIDRYSVKGLKFETVASMFDKSIVGVLESMITRSSIIDNKVASGMLIDFQYAEPYLGKTVRTHINQKVYLDLSALVDLYDPESRFIIIPIGSPSYPLREAASSAMRLSFSREPRANYIRRMEAEGRPVADVVNLIETVESID